MPLSEHEQRMLDAIEKALYEDDPKFATSVDPARIRRRRPIVSICLFVVGLVALVVGVIASQSLLAVGVIVSVARVRDHGDRGRTVPVRPAGRRDGRLPRRLHEVAQDVHTAVRAHGRAIPPPLRRPVAATATKRPVGAFARTRGCCVGQRRLADSAPSSRPRARWPTRIERANSEVPGIPRRTQHLRQASGVRDGADCRPRPSAVGGLRAPTGDQTRRRSAPTPSSLASPEQPSIRATASRRPQAR